MKTIKRLSLLLMGLTVLTACKKAEYTGDVSILTRNLFLQDKNHVLKSMSLTNLLDLLDEQEKGTIEDTNDKDEKITRNRTEAESRTVVIFGKQGQDHNDVLAYFANEAAKAESNLDKVGYVLLVDISTERSDFSASFDSKSDDDNDNNATLTSGYYYETLLNRVGISDANQGEVKFLYNNLWPFGRTCSSTSPGERTQDIKTVEDFNKIDLSKRIPNTGCKGETDGFVHGTKITDSTILSFNKGKFVPSQKYLFDDRVLDSSNIIEIYDLDETNRTKTFNKVANCQIFGTECKDTNYVGVKKHVYNVFDAVLGK